MERFPSHSSSARQPAVAEADGVWLIGLLFVFAASRVAYFLAGVTIDDSFGSSMHVLDLAQLREAPLKALIFQHSQPPLFNALLALIVKIVGAGHVGIGLTLIDMGFAALAMCLFALILRRVGLSRPWAFGMAAVFAVSPMMVLAETSSSYGSLVQSLLVIATFAFQNAMGKRSGGWLFLSLLAFAAVCLMRTSFHLVVLLAVVFCALWVGGLDWRRVALAAVLPVLLVVGSYGKNLVEFGFFGSTSWMWFNLTRMTTDAVPPAERDQLVARGVLSPLAPIAALAPPVDYAGKLALPAPTGIPVLDMPIKSTGEANYNSTVMLAAMPARKQDVMAVLVRYPGLYLKRVARGVFQYLRAPGDTFLERTDWEKVSRIDRIFSILFYGQLVAPADREWRSLTSGDPDAIIRGLEPAGGFRMADVLQRLALMPILAVGFLTVFALVGSARVTRRRDWAALTPFSLLLAALIASNFLISCLFEAQENFRMRLEVEPLYVVALVMAIMALRRKRLA